MNRLSVSVDDAYRLRDESNAVMERHAADEATRKAKLAAEIAKAQEKRQKAYSAAYIASVRATGRASRARDAGREAIEEAERNLDPVDPEPAWPGRGAGRPACRRRPVRRRRTRRIRMTGQVEFADGMRGIGTFPAALGIPRGPRQLRGARQLGDAEHRHGPGAEAAGSRPGRGSLREATTHHERRRSVGEAPSRHLEPRVNATRTGSVSQASAGGKRRTLVGRRRASRGPARISAGGPSPLADNSSPHGSSDSAMRSASRQVSRRPSP